MIMMMMIIIIIIIIFENGEKISLLKRAQTNLEPTHYPAQ